MTHALPRYRQVPRRLVAALALLVVVAGLLVAVIIASRQSRPGDAPPAAPPFEGFAASPVERFTVRTVEGARAVLVADPLPGQSTDTLREVALEGASIEVLRPIEPADIRVGDRLNVIAVYNQVQNFSIRSVVVLDTADAASTLGFSGHEASTDPAERLVLTGIVQATDGSTLTLDAGAEPATVTLLPGSVVYRLEPGSATDVAPGDRIALIERDQGAAFLVLPVNPR